MAWALRAIFMAIAVLSFGTAALAETIILTGSEEQVRPALVDYLETPDTGLSAGQVESERRHQFRPTPRQDLNRGFSSRVHWLRLEIANASPAPLTRWLEVGHARLEWVTVFERTADGWQGRSSGTQVPRRDKAVTAATPVLPITVPAGETRVFLVRVASVTAVDLAATLWEPLAFRSAQAQVQSLQWLVLGAIGLAAAFSLATYLFLRSREHLIFGAGLLCFMFLETSLNGLATEYFWPADRPFATWMVAVWASGFLASLFLFYRQFLNLRHFLPFWDRASLVLAAMNILLVAEEQLRGNYAISAKINALFILLAIVIGFLLGLACLRKGHRSARWLLLGMGASWLSGIPFLLILYGVAIPTRLTQISTPAAMVIASILILVAVTDRLKQVQKDKERAAAESISRLEEQVQERTADLELALGEAHAANRAKTDFLAQISHDLRTPLHTVIGYAQLIRRGSKRIPPRDGAGAIEDSARRLLALIDDLLDYVRTEARRLPTEWRAVYWHGLLQPILDDARHLCEAATNHFHFQAIGTFPQVIAIDEHRLRQILDNLLANANRHTQFGRITLQITAQVDAAARTVALEFRVQDTGSGIPPDKVEHIFDPFVSGSRSIGLGLAISRQLAVALNGKLRLEYTSPQGSGFLFHIVCPLADEAEVPLPTPSSRFTGYAGRRRTILVAEDVAENRYFLCELLTEAGFDVLAVSTGSEALNSLTGTVDLVLTDQSMPDGDGWAVLRGARDLAPGLPVVLVSAAPPVVPEHFPADLTFAAVLLKPVACDALLESVGRLLNIEWESAAMEEQAAPAPAYALGEDDARRLGLLIVAGDVTGIEELGRSLAERGEEYADVAEAIAAAATRLDFQFLRNLAGMEMVRQSENMPLRNS